MLTRQHISGFGHEVHATKNNPLTTTALGLFGSHLAQFEAVTGEVCVLNNIILLIVVPKNQQSIAQLTFPRTNPRRQISVGHVQVTIGQCWLPKHPESVGLT
jgi:hypothetical protein